MISEYQQIDMISAFRDMKDHGRRFLFQITYIVLQKDVTVVKGADGGGRDRKEMARKRASGGYQPVS